jgi:signal transduction histidine kinase
MTGAPLTYARIAWRELLPRGERLPERNWQRRHHFLSGLLLAHAFALPVFGIVEGYGVAHSVLEAGGLLGLLAVAALVLPLSRRLRAGLVAVGLVSASAVLTHFSGGYIEAHFHFFAMILVLSLYEDWLPFLVAIGYVVVHHGLGGAISPEAIYNHPAAQAHPWRWALVHGAAVSFFAALSVASWRINEELRREKDAAVLELREQEEELRRANADLQDLDRLKSEFVAVASHELRTPLTSVLGFTSTLRLRWNELTDGERRDYLDIVEDQARRLGGLVGELLDLSRIDAGQIRVRPEAVELRPLAERLGSGFGADVRVSCPENLVVHADPRHVEQILVNYLANALRYGAEPVEVRAEPINGAVEVRVHDRGPGVAPDFVSRLFEKFTQSENGELHDGTGLGLAIVRGLAEANGGAAWYENSRPGATFAVRLPAGAGALA